MQLSLPGTNERRPSSPELTLPSCWIPFSPRVAGGRQVFQDHLAVKGSVLACLSGLSGSRVAQVLKRAPSAELT